MRVRTSSFWMKAAAVGAVLGPAGLAVFAAATFAGAGIPGGLWWAATLLSVLGLGGMVTYMPGVWRWLGRTGFLMVVAGPVALSGGSSDRLVTYVGAGTAIGLGTLLAGLGALGSRELPKAGGWLLTFAAPGAIVLGAAADALAGGGVVVSILAFLGLAAAGLARTGFALLKSAPEISDESRESAPD